MKMNDIDDRSLQSDNVSLLSGDGVDLDSAMHCQRDEVRSPFFRSIIRRFSSRYSGFSFRSSISERTHVKGSLRRKMRKDAMASSISPVSKGSSSLSSELLRNSENSSDSILPAKSCEPKIAGGMRAWNLRRLKSTQQSERTFKTYDESLLSSKDRPGNLKCEPITGDETMSHDTKQADDFLINREIYIPSSFADKGENCGLQSKINVADKGENCGLQSKINADAKPSSSSKSPSPLHSQMKQNLKECRESSFKRGYFELITDPCSKERFSDRRTKRVHSESCSSVQNDAPLNEQYSDDSSSQILPDFNRMNLALHTTHSYLGHGFFGQPSMTRVLSQSLSHVSHEYQLFHSIGQNQQHQIEVTKKLHEASRKDNLNQVKDFLMKYPSCTRWTCTDNTIGNIAMHEAAMKGSARVMKYLLSVDAGSALVRNSVGQTPLHISVENGHLPTVVLLTEIVPQCAKIKNDYGNLPLHNALELGNNFEDMAQIVICLLTAFKPALYATNNDGQFPIHIAASSGFSAGVRTILALDYDLIHIRDEAEKLSALDIAIDSLNLEVDESNFVSSSSRRETMLSKKPYIECIEILLSSILYKRFIPTPHLSEEVAPFLPLHGAIASHPKEYTWKTVNFLYGSDSENQLNGFGRNAAHILCSIATLDDNIGSIILDDLDSKLFQQVDNFGFLPIHLCSMNPEVPYNFFRKVGSKNEDGLNILVPYTIENKYSMLTALQIAATSNCCLAVVSYLMRKSANENTGMYVQE